MLEYIYNTFIVPLTIIFPFIYAYRNYQYLNRALKILLAFLIFSAIANAIGTVIARGFHMRTTFMVHIYTPFEFAFLSFFFAEFYRKPAKNIIYGITAVFVVFCLYNSLFIQKAMIINSYSRSVDAIILIIYSMLYFLRSSNDIDARWKLQVNNWMVTGILLYYSSALFMFIFFNYLLLSDEMSYVIWNIHNTILIIEYILFAIGYSKCRFPQTISIS